MSHKARAGQGLMVPGVATDVGIGRTDAGYQQMNLTKLLLGQ